jgi:peroxiredoxin
MCVRSRTLISAATACIAGTQTVEEQRAFAGRVGLPYPLISDPRRQLAAALGLPTFTADGQTFYRRITLIGQDGRVLKIFSPVLEPETNAREVADWLEAVQGD